jgi:hypothetical protein
MPPVSFLCHTDLLASRFRIPKLAKFVRRPGVFRLVHAVNLALCCMTCYCAYEVFAPKFRLTTVVFRLQKGSKRTVTIKRTAVLSSASQEAIDDAIAKQAVVDLSSGLQAVEISTKKPADTVSVAPTEVKGDTKSAQKKPRAGRYVGMDGYMYYIDENGVVEYLGGYAPGRIHECEFVHVPPSY